MILTYWRAYGSGSEWFATEHRMGKDGMLKDVRGPTGRRLDADTQLSLYTTLTAHGVQQVTTAPSVAAFKRDDPSMVDVFW